VNGVGSAQTVFHLHPSDELRRRFLARPYQGADPAEARFLFFGLDANYDPELSRRPYFSEVLAYLDDGVRYWRERGFHHPFRHPDYRGDGALYHRRFAAIGFQPRHADQVSFVELIDVPTSGRSALEVADLNRSHLSRLREWILDGQARFIFIPPGVARLMRRVEQFGWLPEVAIGQLGALPILFQSDRKTVFSPFHFSCVGKHCLKKDRDQQLRDIGMLIEG
jgi:hypothetical protein